MPKFSVCLYAETVINTNEFEIEADSKAEAIEKAISMGKEEHSDVVWDESDAEANLKTDTIEVNTITEVWDD